MVSTPLKNISQWERLSHIMMENKTCSKPPTRYGCGSSCLPVGTTERQSWRIFFRAKFDPYHGSAGLRNWGLITFRQDVMLAIQKNIQVVIGANLLGVARDIWAFLNHKSIRFDSSVSFLVRQSQKNNDSIRLSHLHPAKVH